MRSIIRSIIQLIKKIKNKKWKNTLINFIIKLPVSKGCINIIVVIDQLSKIKHLIAYPNILVSTIARLFLDYI